MPKVEATVTTADDTNNRLDPEFVLVTFTPENGEPITVEHYYNKGTYKDPWDFVSLHKRVTVKYKVDNPMDYIIYEETKGDYTKYIGAGVLGLFLAFFFAKETDGGLWAQAKVFSITVVVVVVITLLIVELNARFAWLNFNSKRRDDE